MPYSEKTARSRRTISTPLKWLLNHSYIMAGEDGLDYGCGLGFDADSMGFYKYDPYYFPTKPNRKFDVVVCFYVLNVLLPDDVQYIVEDLKDYVAKDGKCFVAVRRDIKKEGKTTKGYQFNVVMLYPWIKLTENSLFAMYSWQK